jgi:hypothetical protein
MKKIFKSILRDIKSLDMIILNRWHLHAPIAFIAGCLLYFAIRESISDTYVATEIAFKIFVTNIFKIFVPSFIGFIFLFSFESFQKSGRIIGELEKFESDKDLWVGEFFLIIGVIFSYLLW